MTTLTSDEAAALVGVSERLVYKWAENGSLRPVRITTTDRMRFIEAEVVEAAEAHRSARATRRMEAMTRRWQQEWSSVQSV